ncbi:hypothetical protein [Microbacterium sp. K24]|uniref:hypothetical protein n=1 Tax=Microbacterium sp. K24 TaxID=2305446 RepID=UPI001F103B5B|nr:hypothetical protein [Microbacterium sp. K24]
MKVDECGLDVDKAEPRVSSQEVTRAPASDVRMDATAPADPYVGWAFRIEYPHAVTPQRFRAGEGAAVQSRTMQRVMQPLRGEEPRPDSVYPARADVIRQLHPTDAVLLELHAAGKPAETGEEQLWIEHPSTMPGPAARSRHPRRPIAETGE